MAERPITQDGLYRLDDFKKAMGWGDRALRSARRDGLPVRYFGGRGFVLGKDVIDWMTTRSADSAARSEKG